jgi:hypothetical protein
MPLFGDVKLIVLSYHLMEIQASVWRVQIFFFIFNRLPETFNKNVVQGSILAIHGDFDVVSFQHIDILSAGILGTLIGIMYLWRSVFYNSILQELNAPFFVHGIGDTPIKDFSAINIDDGIHVHKPTEHRGIGEVYLPELIRTPYCKVVRSGNSNLLFPIWTQRQDLRFLKLAFPARYLSRVKFEFGGKFW